MLLFLTAHPKLPVIIDIIATTTNEIKLMPILMTCDLDRRAILLPDVTLRSLRLTTCSDGFQKGESATISDRAKDVQESILILKVRMSLRYFRDVYSISIGRDVAFFEVAPISRPKVRNTDRHWGSRNFGEAERRTSGCNVTLAASHAPIYIRTARVVGITQAPVFPRRVRNGKRRDRSPVYLERYSSAGRINSHNPTWTRIQYIADTHTHPHTTGTYKYTFLTSSNQKILFTDFAVWIFARSF